MLRIHLKFREKGIFVTNGLMVFQNLKGSDYAYLTKKDLHLLNGDEDAPPAKINRMVASRQVVNPTDVG